METRNCMFCSSDSDMESYFETDSEGSVRSSHSDLVDGVPGEEDTSTDGGATLGAGNVSRTTSIGATAGVGTAICDHLGGCVQC